MNRLSVFALTSVAAITALSGCAAHNDISQQQEVTGSLSYLSRIMLAPNSVAEVTVRDTSVADGDIVAKQRIDLNKQTLPIPFNVMLNTQELNSGAYSLSAVIKEQDQVSWRTAPKGISVEPGVTEVGDLVLQQVTEGETVTQLEGVEWRVTHLNGEGVSVPAEAEVEASIQFGDDGRMFGRAFCNSFNGSYQLQGDMLSTSQLAGTMMMCDEAQMKHERTMLDILGQAQRVERTDNGSVIVFANDGRSLTVQQ
ncbi:META domain-containing protein [Oceanisphaera pacifica]|uniref:META domain-containing protein n=1 Tax=Oceanisphaera pacifica TaxID=2818389 RepID=A0ABS3NEK2_9GAMM|nr:META domain-containing protein [Oceanisphaera pacifica]MBO1518960.1 META domain-containing protein [Oceanisphaera pacifica]